MSYYDHLLRETAIDREEFRVMPMVQMIIAEGMPKQDYLGFLEQLYHMVWHFVPTIAAAAARCGDNRRDVRYALYDHIEQEKEHETWVLNDIEAVGGDPDIVRQSLPIAPIQALIGYNYDIVQRVNPCGVFGMVHVLEEIAAGFATEAADAISESIGISGPEGISFLSSHGVMDIDHITKLRTLLDTFDDAADQSVVIEASRVNYSLFRTIFEEPILPSSAISTSSGGRPRIVRSA